MDKPNPINEQYEISENGVIISQTDKEGNITFVNKKFSEVSGYLRKELIGKPHSIIRHPDMPKAVFKKMWEHLKSGQAYNGVIKNLRKDGKFYWIELEIIPLRDEKENITGYISVARKANEKDIFENEDMYLKMLEDEKEGE